MKIRIPKELPTAVAASRKEKKLMATFCAMKAIFENGNFRDNTHTRQSVADVCFVSEKTITRRIKKLKQMGFVRQKDYALELVSWSQLAKHYNLTFSTRFYHITTTENTNPQLELIFDQKVIYEYKKECKAAWKFKLEKQYPSLGFDLTKVSGSLHPREVFKHQVNSFARNGADYTSSVNFDLLPSTQRADFNIGSQKLSKRFGYQGKGSMAYRKRVLEKAGLITVKKRTYKLDLAPKTTIEQRDTKLGNVAYFRPEKSLVLQLPDSIEIMSANVRN